MIGFVTTHETASLIAGAVTKAFQDRGLPQFWALGDIPILTGDHAGKHFLPADDSVLSAPLIGNPPLTPRDYPEFEQLIAMLGGLDARVDLDAEHITHPPTDDL
jgi:hypothetical protein